MSVLEVSFEEELSDIEKFLLESPKRSGEATVESTEVIETLNPFHDAHKVREPHMGAPKTLAELVASPEAHPLVLNVLMLRKFGPEYLGWILPAVERGLEEAFGPPHKLTVAKVMAAQLCHTSEGPWTRWECFVPVVSAFTDVIPDFGSMQPVDPVQITVAVQMMNTLEERNIWSDEVKRYMSASYYYYQVMLPIPPVTFLSVQGSWLPHDRESIMRHWPQTQATGRVTLGGIEGEQLRKMLVLDHAQQVFTNRLREQLPLVPR